MNDFGIDFLNAYKDVFRKYVKSASLASIELKDGRTIGVKTLHKYAFGYITIKECFEL